MVKQATKSVGEVGGLGTGVNGNLRHQEQCSWYIFLGKENDDPSNYYLITKAQEIGGNLPQPSAKP